MIIPAPMLSPSLNVLHIALWLTAYSLAVFLSVLLVFP